MSSIQERLQLKRIPLDTWNIREQLCLASAVVRSGDQNWMSVSRALKSVGEPNRPPDWYSQKSCAAQYGVLLEHVETPKRKKRSSEGAVETPQESILKRLTQERIVEIQKTVAEMNQQYEQLKNEILEVRNPSTSEDRLREMWAGIEAAKRAREREIARRAAWLKERDEKRARAERTWRPPATGTTPAPVTTAPTPQPPSSPLLTSLLKSSPVVTTPQHITHPANVVETVSPSAGAPTLSMLLESRAAAAGAPGAPGTPSATAVPTSAPAGSPHEKHAAIEHIKSQLVQIEQQLKASSAGPAAPDIDDIEIKAEDVYVFRDIDLHIPPVAPLHKATPAPAPTHTHTPAHTHTNTPAPTLPPVRTIESPLIKKEDIEPSTPAVEEASPQLLTNIKQQPEEEEADPQETLQADIETSTEGPLAIDEPPNEESADRELKISFPEVKFPTTEIKVIQPDEVKIKEEIKEPEPETPVVEPEKVEEEVVVEEISATEQESEKQEIEKELEHPEQESEQRPIEELPVPPVVEEPLPVVQDPETIPLPPEPAPVIEAEREQAVTEIPVPAEPEPQSEEPKEVKENDNTLQEEKVEDVQTIKQEETENDDVKKDEDAEDSIPLKEMIKSQEVESEKKEEAQQEVKEERAEQEDTHTETDDDTPMELSREEEKDGKKKRDYSRKKKPDSRTCSGSESAAEASAPESPSATEAEKQHRLWKKSVMLVYSRLCAHKYASLFLRPITDEEAPGYSLVVKRPMDLTTIKRNIEQGGIRTTAEFQRDVLLMLSNALMYNSSEHSVYQMAKEMHEEAQCQLGMLLAAQAHAGLAPAPPAARRKRRRSPAAELALPLPPAKRAH